MATKQFKIMINPAPAPPPPSVRIVTDSPLPDGEVGAAYSEILDITDGSGIYVYSLIGSLSDGLSLNTTTGEISGVPTTAGLWVFEVDVTDAPATEPVPPPMGDLEPMPDDPGTSIIWSENFDSYNGIHTDHPTQSDSPRLKDGSGFGPYTDLSKGLQYKTLVPGRNGGNALKFTYSSDPALGGSDILITKPVTKVDEFFIQYWFKTGVGQSPTEKSTSGLKWLMLNNTSGLSRYQNGVNRIAPAECGQVDDRWPEARMSFKFWKNNTSMANYVWSEDPCLPPPFDSIDGGGTPWPNGVNDGEWHRVTIYLKVGSYVKGWLDGVLVWDDEGAGNTYPGRVNEWKMFGNFTAGMFAPDLFEVFLDDVFLWTVEEG